MPSIVVDLSGTGHPQDILLKTLKNSPQTFLRPTSDITAAALDVLKDLLDPLAADIADAQKQRRNENRRKRKRGENDAEESILQIRKVYTKGLGVKQIWEQARRVLDAACSEVEKSAQLFEKSDTTKVSGSQNNNGLLEEDSSDADLDNEDEYDQNGDIEDDEVEALDADDYDEEDEEMLEGVDLEAGSDEEDIEDMDKDEVLSDEPTSKSEIYVPDPNGLNDGFFSIDDFNKQTQFLEQQDIRGEDDNPSDEDEIDWDADPTSIPIGKPTPKKQPLKKKDADDDDSAGTDGEDGPTFGNADLDGPDSDEGMHDEDSDLDDMPGLNNTNEIRYSDFYEPPPKKPSKTKRMRALPKTQPPKQETTQTQEDIDKDIERAMNDVTRDIFASDEESLEADSGSDTDTPRNKNLSTHEKQRAKIASEIRRLEAANVAKRDWTLSGEARAVDRPVNSLIEEDMEFERVGKPVPIITAEVTEEIERLIKRRILAREFDEVVRRHPDAMGNSSETRRGRIELDDAKPQSSLAQLYEQDHLQSTDPGYVDKRSAATKKQHAEIDRLWKEVSSQLDLLSNLHFKPKRREIEIKTVEDKPTISMEDARPAGVAGEESMLAPQEIYQPGEKRKGVVSNGEVTRKSGASVNKEEMSREEKVRKRRREKERMKKAGSNKPINTSTTTANGKSAGEDRKGKEKKADKNDILADLRKGNVKVIGKKGELQDLGKQKKLHEGGQSSSAFKL